MKDLLAALKILIPLGSVPNVRRYHAAGHLVAAQVVFESPKPILDERGEAL